ncbi:MAG: hypothetical protein AB7E12_06795 [Burkholderiaceae bacterium]|jgi:hypothetical protein
MPWQDALPVTSAGRAWEINYLEKLSMKRFKALSTAVVTAVFALALAGCQEKEGPAEKAGKELDKAASQVGQAVENAGEQLQKAVK